MLLYVTADKVGQANHGAGAVTGHESQALASLDKTVVIDRDVLAASGCDFRDVWSCDDYLVEQIKDLRLGDTYQLAHFYAGTFSRTVAELKRQGCKVAYTAAAHSIEESRREHESLGQSYQYPHITDPALWERYVGGYLAADLLITPSQHSAGVMRSFGADAGRVRVIPHGCKCDHPLVPIPGSFALGYLGNTNAPDKGLRYLFSAWSRLAYKDAVLKVAGHDSATDYTRQLWKACGGRGHVQFCGWVDDVSDYYNSLSCYVQPSVTEGFGIEIGEGLAAGRVVICSRGAGASDLVPEEWRFPARDVGKLCELIERARQLDAAGNLGAAGLAQRNRMSEYTWDKVQSRYVEAWRSLL